MRHRPVWLLFALSFILFACSCFPLRSSAQTLSRPSPAIGGNVSSLRPSFTAEDLAKCEKSAAYLPPGSIARVQTIFWEIYWSPDSPGDYRGIDACLQVALKHKLRPLILLSPTPHPSSPWNAGSDWWMPSRSAWPKIDLCVGKLVTRIQRICKDGGQTPMFQLLNEPAGRSINPPMSEKPGGSNQTTFGEWHPDLHEFCFGLVQVLKEKGVSRSCIVAPAISTVGEGSKREAAEWLSSLPPPQFDWLSECGYRAFHIRMSAGWATDPKTRLEQVTGGFTNCAQYLAFCDQHRPNAVAQRVMLTELYVTPGDCGLNVGDDLDPYRSIAIDLCKRNQWTAIVWGLLPGETDAPGDRWLTYGGWGDWFNRQ